MGANTMDHEMRLAEREGDTAKLERMRARIAPKPPEKIGEWHTMYEDLPHGAFYAKDETHYIDCIQVTDLASACGAEGLVMVEKRSTGLDGHADGIRSAMQCVGLESGFAEDIVTRGMKRGESRAFIREHVRLILAEALVSYGLCDTDETIIAWQERPEALSCNDAPAENPCCHDTDCTDGVLCEFKRADCQCGCHNDVKRAARERNEQRQSWDSWRPNGYHKGSDGEMHAEYEGDDGLTSAIESMK